MRGWPGAELLVSVLLLSVVGIAFACLIERGGGQVHVPETASMSDELASKAAAANHVNVTFYYQTTGDYYALVIRSDGIVLHRLDEGKTREGWFNCALPAGGNHQIVVEVAWSNAGTRNALGIEAAPDGQEAQSLTLWGEGSAQGVLEISLEGTE